MFAPMELVGLSKKFSGWLRTIQRQKTRITIFLEGVVMQLVVMQLTWITRASHCTSRLATVGQGARSALSDLRESSGRVEFKLAGNSPQPI